MSQRQDHKVKYLYSKSHNQSNCQTQSPSDPMSNNKIRNQTQLRLNQNNIVLTTPHFSVIYSHTHNSTQPQSQTFAFRLIILIIHSVTLIYIQCQILIETEPHSDTLSDSDSQLHKCHNKIHSLKDNQKNICLTDTLSFGYTVAHPQSHSFELRLRLWSHTLTQSDMHSVTLTYTKCQIVIKQYTNDTRANIIQKLVRSFIARDK